MKHFGLALAAAIAWPSVASGQLVVERIDSLERVCSYAPRAATPIGPGQVREHRVGLAQNCPDSAPPTESTMAAPPTAQLLSEGLDANYRTCVYQQAGVRWSFSINPARHCPLSAGLITDQDRAPSRIGSPVRN